MMVQNAHGGRRRPPTPPARTCTTSARASVRSRTSIYQAPGRLNVFDLDGVKVIIDYAHNAAGLRDGRRLRRAHDADAPNGGRPGEPTWTANLRVAVVATAGDRRDEDMRELGRVAARYFDEVIVREDVNTRGRERGETAALDRGGRPRGDGGGRARRQRRDRARRDGGGAPGARPGAARRRGRALRRLRDRGVQGARAAARRGLAGDPARERGRQRRRGRRPRLRCCDGMDTAADPRHAGGARRRAPRRARASSRR